MDLLQVFDPGLLLANHSYLAITISSTAPSLSILELIMLPLSLLKRLNNRLKLLLII